MEFAQPTERFNVYQFTNGPSAKTYKATTWFAPAVNAADSVSRVLAENVVALIITPRLPKVEETPLQGGNADLSPLAPKYSYDSTGFNTNPLLNPKNQLPPIVQVTMVALDEKSAEKIGDSTKPDLLGVSGKFTNTADFTKDLSLDSTRTDSLEKTLVGLKAQYRVFTTKVHIRGAKWSREQTDTK